MTLVQYPAKSRSSIQFTLYSERRSKIIYIRWDAEARRPLGHYYERKAEIPISLAELRALITVHVRKLSTELEELTESVNTVRTKRNQLVKLL